MDVRVSKVEVWVHIAEDLAIRFDYLFELHLDEEIERADVLFNQTFYFEESRK